VDIYLSNGDKLRGDAVVRAVLRTDLVPVPMTLECSVRYSAELEPLLRDGQMVRAGPGLPDLRIVWASPDMGGSGAVQGRRALGEISFVALLNSCADVAFLRSKAVIKEGATLGAIYRACGAKVQIESDFTVDRFSCFAGGVPAFHIAQALQEQAGALVWVPASAALKFKRLPDLFTGKPVETIDSTGIERVKSGFMERHEIPWFYSTDPSGAVMHGNRARARKAMFTPRKPLGVLNNMSRALVQWGSLTGRLAAGINAGDLVEVGADGNFVVVTAAHVIEGGGDGVNTYTRLWLAGLEQ
jgi:hypothetical protein